jgi:Ca-activated chloride channel family protein
MTKTLNLFALCFAFIFIISCENSRSLQKGDNGAVEPTNQRVAINQNERRANLDLVTEEKEESYDDEIGIEPATQKQKQLHNTEEYDKIVENQFQGVAQNPVSTFSIDVDNASYSNMRRYLDNSSLPPAGAVRIEEMINYFDYDYPQPQGMHPFSINTEISAAPWNANHHLIHIGLQGKELDYDNMKPSNLVFLIDASGSMSDNNKLPLLKKGLKLLLSQLDDKDKVSIVAYAGAAGLVLPATAASETATILNALDGVTSGGSTAGGQGIQLAYKIAKENLMEGGNNRVILATDGDFNVGVSSSSDLVSLIEEKRKDDIYLTICGFGMGNYKDGRMEQISNAGNGNYFYIDNVREAEKVFVKEMRANMFTIAKDVKIQIEFNPNTIKAYRLVGYENRMLAKEDFDDDTKDAGELGAGHTVTAIYEVIFADSKSTQEVNTASNLKYQTVVKSNNENDLMTVKFRYKLPTSDKSTLIEQVLVKGKVPDLAETSDNFRFSASVAAFGMILRSSEFKGEATYGLVSSLAKGSLRADKEGYRAEFLQLVNIATLIGEPITVDVSN